MASPESFLIVQQVAEGFFSLDVCIRRDGDLFCERRLSAGGIPKLAGSLNGLADEVLAGQIICRPPDPLRGQLVKGMVIGIQAARQSHAANLRSLVNSVLDPGS
jgi:hypothetical protein